MNPPTPPELPADVRAALRAARVTRSVAMRALGYDPHNSGAQRTFHKVVDAHPALRHRLPGEGRDRYRSAVLLTLLTNDFRGANRGGTNKPNKT